MIKIKSFDEIILEGPHLPKPLMHGLANRGDVIGIDTEHVCDSASIVAKLALDFPSGGKFGGYELAQCGTIVLIGKDNPKRYDLATYFAAIADGLGIDAATSGAVHAYVDSETLCDKKKLALVLKRAKANLAEHRAFEHFVVIVHDINWFADREDNRGSYTANFLQTLRGIDEANCSVVVNGYVDFDIEKPTRVLPESTKQHCDVAFKVEWLGNSLARMVPALQNRKRDKTFSPAYFLMRDGLINPKRPRQHYLHEVPIEFLLQYREEKGLHKRETAFVKGGWKNAA